MNELNQLLDYELKESGADYQKDKRRIISILLLVLIIIIWVQFYVASSLPYDENFGSIFSGIILSALIFIVLLIILFKRRKWITDNILVVSLYVVTSSPLSLILVAYNYESIFGAYLDIG